MPVLNRKAGALIGLLWNKRLGKESILCAATALFGWIFTDPIFIAIRGVHLLFPAACV